MARKRYHQSVKDRLAESRGMERHELKHKRKRAHERDESASMERAEHHRKRQYDGHHDPAHPSYHAHKKAQHHSRDREYGPEMEYVMHNEAYRRRMESEGSHMIFEDPRAIANLPERAIMREYPHTDYEHYRLDDTMRKIDHQIEDDLDHGPSKVGKEYPEMY